MKEFTSAISAMHTNIKFKESNVKELLESVETLEMFDTSTNMLSSIGYMDEITIKEWEKYAKSPNILFGIDRYKNELTCFYIRYE